MILILCLITVTSGLKIQQVFMSRNSRSDSDPIETGYVYNQVNDDPGTLAMFNSKISEPVLENYTELKNILSPVQFHPMDFSRPFYKPYESSLSKRDLDYAVSKSESKYNGNFLPSKIKTDLMYERLRSAMHYKPGDDEAISRYDEYHMDDDDVRSSSSDMYDNWPLYHNPYEHEHMKIDAVIEKAKDKRYAVDAAKVIPIHEDLSDDIPTSSYEHIFATKHYDITTDNPMTGHDPFFSFVLNDYFDKTSDDDHLTFKGLDWDKELDTRPITGIGDHTVTNRLLRSYPRSEKINNSQLANNVTTALHSDSVTEKGFKKHNEFEQHEKGDAAKTNDRTKYNQDKNKQTGFKDFLDSFANKFGSENHKKDINYAIKRNQDNGEKRKGFRRVYHKDEYQEDNEFYNNKDNSALSEENGSSNSHFGGTEGQLSSHAIASLGNESNSFNKAGDTEKNNFEHNHKGYDNNKGLDGNLHRYRDLAQNAAQINDVYNSDHYRS